MVSVRWTGAAGLEISHEGAAYLMDPDVARPGKTAVFFKRLLQQLACHAPRARVKWPTLNQVMHSKKCFQPRWRRISWRVAGISSGLSSMVTVDW